MCPVKVAFVCRDIKRSDEKIEISTSSKKKIKITGKGIVKYFQETTIKDETSGDTVAMFFCPPTDKRQGWKDFRTELRSWLDGETAKVSYVDKCHLRWWEESRKTGLILPMSCVKIFDIDNYLLKRSKLNQFRDELTQHFSRINLCQKNKFLPFAPMWREYCNELKKAKHRRNRLKMRQLVINAAKADVDILLQSFIFHCLPLLIKRKQKAKKWFNKKQGKGKEKEKKQPKEKVYPKNECECDDWMNSEYLYIFDECCNAYNREMLRESRQKVCCL